MAMAEPACPLPPTRGQLASQLGANARADGRRGALSPPSTACSDPRRRQPRGGEEEGTVTRHIPGLRTTPQPQPDAARTPLASSRVTWPGGRPAIGRLPQLLRRRRPRGRDPSRDGGRRSGFPQPAAGWGFTEMGGPCRHTASVLAADWPEDPPPRPFRRRGNRATRGPGLGRSEDPQEGGAASVTWPPPRLEEAAPGAPGPCSAKRAALHPLPSPPAWAA